MGQPKHRSAIESCTNTTIGFLLAYLAGLLVYPAFGIEMRPDTLGWITLVFTLVSILRGYVIRRIFNRIDIRGGSSHGSQVH